MATTTVGIAIIFGVDPKWVFADITNLPADTINVRRRFRSGSAAKAFVKRSDGSVSGYLLVPSTGRFDTSTTMRLGPWLAVNKSGKR